jgi:hypothetical protein
LVLSKVAPGRRFVPKLVSKALGFATETGAPSGYSFTSAEVAGGYCGAGVYHFRSESLHPAPLAISPAAVTQIPAPPPASYLSPTTAAIGTRAHQVRYCHSSRTAGCIAHAGHNRTDPPPCPTCALFGDILERFAYPDLRKRMLTSHICFKETFAYETEGFAVPIWAMEPIGFLVRLTSRPSTFTFI